MKFETFRNGIKSVHSAAFDYEIYTLYKFHKTHSGKSVRMKSEAFHNGIKSVHPAAPDYEMHELYDAFSYSNNYFALNDLIRILSPIISV